MQHAAFTIYWHRAGNSVAGIQAAIRAARNTRTVAGRPLLHGVEADLKWALHNGSPLLYLHHGLTGLGRLSAATVAKRAAQGALLQLDAALNLPGATALHWMVEVKRGHGSQLDAIWACVALFRTQGALDRLLFASSALPVLSDIRAAHPQVQTGLFVGWTFRDGRVLHVPKVQLRRARRDGAVLDPNTLSQVDLFIPTNPLAAGRSGPRPQAPLARSWRDLERFAAAGLAGAFAYFEPS